MRKHLNIRVLIPLSIFVVFSIWWLYLNVLGIKTDDLRNQLFGSLYGLIALYGAIWGLYIAQKWGGIKSVLGRSILFFSAGLFAQEIGQLIYSYYIIIAHIEVPYPSMGDVFFYSAIPLYIVAVIFLAQASGVHVSLRSFGNKLQAILIPVVILAFSYYFFLQEYSFDWTAPLKMILDFGVPLGQAIYISLAILTYTLTRGVLGGMMKNKVLFILFALLAQYIADWTFLYQASRGIWSGGGINDYMYLCAYFIMTLGLLQFKTIFDKLRQD